MADIRLVMLHYFFMISAVMKFVKADISEERVMLRALQMHDQKTFIPLWSICGNARNVFG